ncbi:hypothetical protein RJT06_02470 [Bacteroides ovatus]|uniref:hypothetical protein n=1 Tax=Bacteroides ovatus TaxID=28116 RepID=UPI0029160684|nr:hypothetical protein [Bacteroides ovatus]MDV3115427.1 hypothetical protein [Bacteroides ovatus]
MSKEKQIWDLVSRILDNCGEESDRISIHESEDTGNYEFHRKIYTHHGYCFELTCYTDCAPEEISDVENGCVYCFSEPWDGFNEAGIDKAIEILKELV